ncbi:hypothetical protein [Marinobacter sp. ATCH36]|uniref:hypothetical protein n=1 Tax=Marinobacter sp. ATCH36 TaxID=2945106 RepID=UPI0020224EAA|nr:hypothetical protein [Marinobacter sp. ATCH36]MCL7942922.1 hypothetical protein [Marinobacter sp. ATCH36]
MSRTYGLKTASDLLAKLDRDAKLLQEGVSSDRFFNFVVTAYSLADWVQNDPVVPQPAKADLQRFRGTTAIKICRDLANASKHFLLDPTRNPNPAVSAADSDQGFGAGRFGVGDYGIGEEKITVILGAGNSIDGLDLMEDTLMEWQQFFSNHGI